MKFLDKGGILLFLWVLFGLGFPKKIFFSCYLINFSKNQHNLSLGNDKMPDKLFSVYSFINGL